MLDKFKIKPNLFIYKISSSINQLEPLKLHKIIKKSRFVTLAQTFYVYLIKRTLKFLALMPPVFDMFLSHAEYSNRHNNILFSNCLLFQAKMKLLTFMQLAETKNEISFGQIQQHMQLGDNEVEEFLIERKNKRLLSVQLPR